MQHSTLSSGILHTTRNSDMIHDDNISKTLDIENYYTPATILSVIRFSKENSSCLFNQDPDDVMDIDNEMYFRTIKHQIIRHKSSLRENWS